MPATPTYDLLPPRIAEQHQRLTQLLITCNDLSFHDAASTLREEFDKQQAKGYYALVEFVDRLPTYITNHLRREYQEKFLGNSGLLTSFRHTVRLARARPENWPFWAVSDRPQLLQQRKYLADCLVQEAPQGNPATIASYTTRLENVERILAGLEDLESNNGLALNANDVGLAPDQSQPNQAQASVPLLSADLPPSSLTVAPLAHLHPAVQQAAGSLFDTNHYPHAIQAACTALEKAIQQKSGQSASTTGTVLIGKAFPKDNPLLTLSADQGEREGYGFLYRGLLQAVRNHYAHNLPETSAPRALEWLSFISALFHKLDEAQLTPAPPQP